MNRASNRLPATRLMTIVLELAIILVASVIATSQFLTPDPNKKLPGYEGEYLTNSATFAFDSLKRYGYLPLWQSTLATGEPVIENPFSFTLNPISTLPSLLYGSNIGMRYSVVLTAMLAGVGGWVLGSVLGFGSLGRVLLGLLLAGKGNMLGMIAYGEFQLGNSQAYIPWVLAGVIGVLRHKQQRISVVLTALMLTLMFWAGNIYFLLPTLLCIAGLALTHLPRISFTKRRIRIGIDRRALLHLIIAGMLTVGLSAVTLLPIFLNQSHVGAHSNEVAGGQYADLQTVTRMFFFDSNVPYTDRLVPGGADFYQSFIVPGWFALLALIVFPLLTLMLTHSLSFRRWKVISVGAVLGIFCLLWGTGQNPIITWGYKNLPLLAQWRYVPRMLAISSFWLAVIAVIPVDAFWNALIASARRQMGHSDLLASFAGMALGLIAALSLIAVVQVLAQWKEYTGPGDYAAYLEDRCITWLRQQYPDNYLSVWTSGYSELTVYTLNQVRHFNIGGAFFPLGSASTLFKGDLTRLDPEYGLAFIPSERAYLIDEGYEPLTDSPPTDETHVCVWRKADAIPYAFTVSQPVLEWLDQTLPAAVTTPITRMVNASDQIGLVVDGSATTPVVVVVQEVSYPGWTAQVDGQAATVESIGGLIGVVLPSGNTAHVVYFAYRPPLVLWGGVLSVITALVCIGCLLRVDRRLWRRRIPAAALESAH